MRVEKNGKKWRIRENRGGKTITLESGFTTKTAANNRLTVLMGEQLTGTFIDPRGRKTLLSDWLDLWWPGYEASLKRSARQQESSRVANHIRPMLGHYALEDLMPLRILGWVGDLAAGRGPDVGIGTRRTPRQPLAPKSIRNTHGLLHRILDAAVGERLIRINPATGTSLPRKVHHEMRFLNPPEMARLLAACPEDYRPLVLLFLATGLRYGEAVALRAGDVDLMEGKVRVTRSMHHGAGGQVHFVEPKSEQSRRTVTIPMDVALALAGTAAGKEREELMFCRADGQHLTRTFRQLHWPKIRDAAGLTGLRIHDLRHTHAAMLISDGRPLTAIQRRMGHSSIKVTSDLYGHLMPEVDSGILAAVSASLGMSGLGVNLGVADVDSGKLRAIAVD
jgi:integrase